MSALLNSQRKSKAQLIEEIALLRNQLAKRDGGAARGEDDHLYQLRAQVLDSLPVLIAYVDQDLRYVFNNRAYGTWFSVNTDSLIGKTIQEVVGKPAYKHIRPHLERALSGQPVYYESAIPFEGDRIRYVAARYMPKFDGEGNVQGLYAIVSDITEARQMSAQLAQAQKIQSLGQLTGGVAHDFNNLLGVIQGNAELLQLQVKNNAQAASEIASIIAAVNRGAALTKRLLAFARHQDLSPIVVDISKQIDDSCDMLQRTLGETIELAFTSRDEQAHVCIDTAQLENALLNLAVNARDAMPDGGELHIETSAVSVDKESAELFGEMTPGDYITVSVSDTGEGIDSALLERVFDPFFTTKDISKGSGLGLSMVYGFAKQSGGHITVDSTQTVGTTFTLYFPRTNDPLTPVSTDNEVHDSPAGGECVLVLEDDESLRNIPITILRDNGYDVIEASSGKEALAQLRSGLHIDLLFTDVVLPGGISGFDVAKAAVESQPDIKIIFTTGYAQNSTEGEDLTAPTITLSKPYRRTALLQTVRNALNEKTEQGDT